MAEYELWLDESGKFKNESALKVQNFKPSVIGGILLEKRNVGSVDLNQLLDDSRNHAMNLSDEDKRGYVLPILERLQTEYEARQVFFENADYEDESTNRQLYLRIMAEGLLQLFQTLNAQSEKVVLNVIIAQRQDVDSPIGQRRILDTEYIQALRQCIAKKKKEHRLIFDEKSQLLFKIRPAHTEKRLQLADFACNTRMTRDSFAFKDVKSRVIALYDNAYIFSLTEISSENYIKRSLAQGCLADAVMELYSTKDELDHKKQLALILERVRNMDYRLIKSQLKEFVSEIVSYVAKQDDYKVGENFLTNIKIEFITAMEGAGYSCHNLKVVLLLQLSDMFLREGNIVAARKELEECRAAQLSLGNSLEEVFSYYQLKEKESLLLIDEFNFQEAYKLLDAMRVTFEHLMSMICCDENLKKRFPNLRSEYYGDVLCMQIYAMMFLQRENPHLYEEMCRLSDIALKNYPEQEGELERHRQYRSHIELEKGNYEEALRWLLRAQCWKCEDLTTANLIRFLKQIYRVENEVSCQYYFMYYLLILVESKRAGSSLSDIMYETLKRYKELLRFCGIEKSQPHADSVVEVDIKYVQQEDSGIKFHPMEIIHWKYASYWYYSGKYKKAYPYYCSAEQICFEDKNCHTMCITGIGIMAEKICCMVNGRENGISRNVLLLKSRIKDILSANLPEKTQKFVKDLEREIVSACQDINRIQVGKLLEVSRKITY